MMNYTKSPVTKRPTDKIVRPWLLTEYVNNMVEYFKLKNKSLNISETELRHVIMQLALSQLKDPTIDVVVHKEPGHAEMQQQSLLQHLKSIKDDKIILPFGSVYKPPQQVVSFLKSQIIDLKKRRSTSKKLMLQYKSEGNLEKAAYYNADQNQQKISMNSIPGAMGNKYSFITDIAGFNSITSTGRYFIISSYANCERLLEGNFYFTDIDSFINHCVLLLRICPSEEVIMEALKILHLPLITADEVLKFYEDNISIYSKKITPPSLFEWLSNIPQYKLSFIYYYNNLVHIFRNNPEFSLSYIHELFNNENAPSVTTDPNDLYSIDKDLVIMVSTVYSDLLPLINGKKTNIYDTVTEYPEIAIKLTDIAKYMQSKIDRIQPALDVFLKQDLVIPNVIQHKNMYRKTVIASDTDSIIFTTKNWLLWFTNSVKITQDTYKINTYIVYLLTKSTEHLMKLLSHHRGATNDDINGMVMKNEYFYPVMTLSNVKKHYAGIYLIQEGTILPKPTSDIKGGQFRGSKLSEYTLRFIKDFIDETHTIIVNEGKISIRERINKIIGFELEIRDSLLRGETKFLPIVPIRIGDTYDKVDASIYFNYQVWEFIFSKKYGSIQLPTKCYILPIKKINSEEYLSYLLEVNKEAHDALLEFVGLHPKKNITRLPLNPELPLIPPECIPLIRIRDIMLDNAKPLYLYLKSLNLWSGGTKSKPVLLSELFNYIPIELS